MYSSKSIFHAAVRWSESILTATFVSQDGGWPLLKFSLEWRHSWQHLSQLLGVSASTPSILNFPRPVCLPTNKTLFTHISQQTERLGKPPTCAQRQMQTGKRLHEVFVAAPLPDPRGGPRTWYALQASGELPNKSIRFAVEQRAQAVFLNPSPLQQYYF